MINQWKKFRSGKLKPVSSSARRPHRCGVRAAESYENMLKAHESYEALVVRKKKKREKEYDSAFSFKLISLFLFFLSFCFKKKAARAAAG
jgi:hypothetical protein